MLAYGSTIPQAIGTERTIPFCTPNEIYKILLAVAPKRALGIGYNVSFDSAQHYPPSSLPNLKRGKPFQIVNNKAEALVFSSCSQAVTSNTLQIL